MYFYLVCSPELFAVATVATKIMVLIDHDFVGNSTSPLFAFLSCPFHMGISLPLGGRLIGVFGDQNGCEKL